MNLTTLGSLDLEHVRNYLRLDGWTISKQDDRRSIWTSPDSTRLLLPVERLGDYIELMAEVVQKVSAAAHRSEDDVLIDMSWPGYDKLTARTHADSPSPAIPLQDAINASDALRDLVVAAARAAENPQPSFRGGWSANVGQYFDQVRMIPSMPGSFTLRALLPINPEPPEELLLQDVDTANIRAVTRTLLSGVHAAAHAAVQRVEGGPITVFRDAVPAGVSAELLDAIVRLGGMETQAGAIEIGVAWTFAGSSRLRVG